MTNISVFRLHERFAVGATASVHFGSFALPVRGATKTRPLELPCSSTRSARGALPARLVAVKRLHPNVVEDEDVVARVLEQARLAMRITHPNVVATLDVARGRGEVLAAMEYIPGASVAEIAEVVPGGLEPRIACAIAAGALRGLQAAHEAHASRDVSPRRVIVGGDGRVRVIGFGARVPTTAAIVDALPYTSPERLAQAHADTRRDVTPVSGCRGSAEGGTRDVWAASVVLWETLTGRSLFRAETVEGTLRRILSRTIPAPSRLAPWIGPKLDAIVLRGLARNPDRRFASPHAMAIELEQSSCASAPEVARALARMDLACVRRRRRLEQRAQLHLE